MPELLHFAESAAAERGEHDRKAGHPAESLPSLEARRYCAYNRTRERFLGSDIEAADFSAATLDTHLATVTPGSGAGLWIVPFRGITPTSIHTPVDLVFLDVDCVVIDTVESFPISPISSSGAPASSVLALPAHTIDSAETRHGDQLILCAADEMIRRLSLPQRPIAHELPAAAVLTVPHPAPSLPAAPSANYAEPATQHPKPPKNWLQRWLSPDPPDPRKAPREVLPGLVAYFFTGGTPSPNRIRDISRTGLYVFTQERWYLGTIVRITLTDRLQPTMDRSITLNARVVRWGNDGVGLQFILHDSKDRHPDHNLSTENLTDVLTAAQVEQFLNCLRSSQA